MCNAYSVYRGDTVLLVGEGNFSFTKDFVNLNNITIKNDCGIEIVTSCRESQFDSFSKFKKENIKDLRDQGITVLLDVDATKLNFVLMLQGKKFTKVIFNFPHVGGKMKIHLNRKLLKEFFSSACDVLSDDGCIVVALCDGQGGTEADSKVRRWDDTWQITEMAAQSNLILHEVEHFDISCFPQYVNNGFRSLEKSFHCNNAVVHMFKKQNVPHILQDCPDRWLRNGNCNVENIFEFIDSGMNNPFSNSQSASLYVCNILIDKLGSKFYLQESVLSYYKTAPLNFEIEPIVLLNDQVRQSMSDIYETFDKEYIGKHIITKVLAKNLHVKNFVTAPVKCQLLVFGVESDFSVFLEFLTETLKLFDCKWHINVKDTDNEYQYVVISNQSNDLTVIEVIRLKNGIKCYICNIDDLAQVLFRLDDWRLLWNGNIDCAKSKCPSFSPVSLFPRAFSFDLGLSAPLNFKEHFEEKLFLHLWLLAGDIITGAELLTTYLPSDRDLVCFCYRITYKSFNAPLHRKRVIYFHEKIIAQLVSKHLRINIT